MILNTQNYNLGKFQESTQHLICMICSDDEIKTS